MNHPYITSDPFIRDRDDWRLQARCRNDPDPDDWYPSGTNSHFTPESKRAVEICHICPVATQCLDTALANGEQFGTWGGLHAATRNTIIRSNQLKEAI